MYLPMRVFCAWRGGTVGGAGVGVGSWPGLPCCLIKSFESVPGTPCEHLHFFCGGFKKPSVRIGFKNVFALRHNFNRRLQCFETAHGWRKEEFLR